MITVRDVFNINETLNIKRKLIDNDTIILMYNGIEVVVNKKAWNMLSLEAKVSQINSMTRR